MLPVAGRAKGLAIVGGPADAAAIARALADENPILLSTAAEAVAAIQAEKIQIGVASASFFRDEEVVRRLDGIPWVVLTDSVDEELSLLQSSPSLDARCLTRDAAGRYLELLAHRVRSGSGRERLLATISAHFPGMVAYWDASERCRYANDAYRTWFDRTPAELLGTSLRELLGPVYALNEPHIRAALRGIPQRFERVLPDPAGGPPRHSLATYTPDVDAGVVRGFVAVVTDISEQHRLREEIAARERRWAALFALLPVGVSVIDADGEILEVNPALQKILGLELEDFRAHRHRERLYVRRDGSPFQPSELPSARAIATSGSVDPVEIGVVKEDGATVWTEVSAQAFPEEPQTVVVTRDLTAERRSEARFAAIVAASPVPFALNDEEGTITFLNPAFVATFGYTIEDVPTIAHWWPKAYPDATYRAAIEEEWRARLDRARQGRAFEPMELRIRAKDGTDRVVIGSATSLEGSFASVHLVVLHDITAERTAETLRLQHERQRLDAQKMESVGALAAGIAHDFNNILAPILANAELTLDALPASSPLRDGVEGIIQGVSRAADLVRQILQVSRPGKDTPQRVDLGALVREVAQLTRASGPPGISVQADVAEDLPLVVGDEGRLHQVVLNLVVNARDAMQEVGGVLTIAVDRSEAGGVELMVRDTGSGMAPEVVARIYEPYFTTKVGGRGTGLGLSTVHAIVTRLGGTISVESAEGRGTTFRVRLPGVAAERECAPSPRSKTGTAGGVSVLVVDDEPAVARSVALVLQRLGYRPTEAHSGKEALAKLASQEDIAAVLTDLTMPGMNGLALAEEVRKVRAIPVLLMTGYGGSIENARERGVVCVLEKPCSISVLGEAMRAALEARVGST